MKRPSLRSMFRTRSARAAARGVRPDVALPFDMFDEARTARQLGTSKKLANLYHKGQKKAWNGRELLATLTERHGGVKIAPDKKEAIAELFAVILWGELAAWKVSADLALQLEPMEAKLAATAQAHDEARHFYVMHDYLELLLGEVPKQLNPEAERVLEGTLKADSLTKQLLGMQMMIEPMALTIFQIVREQRIEPVLADLLEFYERDEARHVALGVLHLPKLLTGMTIPEAIDLWSWQFRQFWAEVALVRSLEPALLELGIDPRQVIEVGRNKQVRANLMLLDELGTDHRVLPLFMRFFDAKCEWEFPTKCDRRDLRARLAGAFAAALEGDMDVPMNLTNVAA